MEELLKKQIEISRKLDEELLEMYNPKNMKKEFKIKFILTILKSIVIGSVLGGIIILIIG